jgi:tRNA U34 2-thiouridine synthase MnmA/TrmU
MVNRSDITAVGLLSAGLDSTLALVHMHRLGFRVKVYHFANGVHSVIHTGAAKPLALATAESLGAAVTVIDNSRELLEVVKHPAHGYGANVNPCIDCRMLMFRMAFARMKAEGARFLFTGEVVGQRPMSQRRQVMDLIDRESGTAGYVVRPLCGKLLPPTVPETEGLFGRDDLFSISGRSRKPQMALAREWGITTYESPAGGCLLTDPAFAVRMRDVLRFGPLDVHEVQLLKVGRHFRLTEKSKAVLGRNAEDCEVLSSLLGPADVQLEACDIPGPLATVRGEVTSEALRRTAALVLRYAKVDPAGEHGVKMTFGDGRTETILVSPAAEAECRHALIAAEGECGGFE